MRLEAVIELISCAWSAQTRATVEHSYIFPLTNVFCCFAFGRAVVDGGPFGTECGESTNLPKLKTMLRQF